MINERDFYWALLNLGMATEVEGLLEQALGLILTVVGARCGYLELRTTDSDEVWSHASALDSGEVDRVRTMVSGGILAEALHSGKTVVTASALLDPRFQKRQSVVSNQIEQCVCAPVGADPVVGALYLQGSVEGVPFSAQAVERIELFARHLAPYADRLTHRASAAADPTAKWRKQIDCANLVGRSEALAELLERIVMVAPLDMSVLLTGPTGAGKTEVARVLHRASGRSGAFVELNCAALPDDLIESELFGAEKGAHSTATERKPGKVELARGGTLFLDEVGELPLASQAKLLQVLQSGEYWALGGAKPKVSDARIVAATNVDLEQAVRRKAFRPDLFYRLNVFSVPVVGLEHRREDILPLATHFVQKATVKFDLPSMRLLGAARHRLVTQRYPGNIRQLMHTLERAVVLAAGEGTTELGVRHLARMDVSSVTRAEGPETYAEHLAEFQKGLLLTVLEEAHGNVSEAARRLGLTRSHVYTLLRTHDIQVERLRREF